MQTAGGVMIQDRKVLVVRGKGRSFFIAPGGRIEENEPPLETIKRELKEELNIEAVDDNIEEFDTFSAPAVNHPGQTITMKAYLIKEWTGDPIPSSEIEEIAWINSADLETKPLGTIFTEAVIPRLKAMNLVD